MPSRIYDWLRDPKDQCGVLADQCKVSIRAFLQEYRSPAHEF
jgi:hypothetical protein